MRDWINTHLNGICPYFTMFPLEFPLKILNQYSQKSDKVLDPFCGRGTTNYASRLMGLDSIGIDSSPVAVAISQSKMANTTPQEVTEIAKTILDQTTPRQVPEGNFWSLAYHKDVLVDLCKIRESLLHDCHSDARKALRGIMLGSLHGPRKKQGSSYFSNQSQRTYAPKPNYAVSFWRKNHLRPEKVNVINIIEARAVRYYSDQTRAKGKILQGDSRFPSTFLAVRNKVNWIITSPPYYGMRTYVPDQWLRSWFLGGKPDVDYSANEQLRHTSQGAFTEDLRSVWINVANICNDNAQLVIRFGKFVNRKVSPVEIIKESFMNTNWKCKTIKSAGTAAKGYRQAIHMTKNASVATEEFDVWARLES